MQYVANTIDGTRIAYRSAGAGPAVVMVHGSALSQVIWRGFGYVRDFATDHTVVTLDLRGHGRSEKPHEETAYRTDFLVADVLTVLDALAIDRAHYLGYSLGGRVGFAFAAAHPERLTSFVSVGGAARNTPGAFDRLFFPGCIHTLETGGMRAFIDMWEAHSGQRLDPSTRAAFMANDADALAAYAGEANRDPGVPDDALAAITIPTLLLVGSQDRERMSAARHALSVMPNASLQILDGSTHADTLRHPDALRTVRAFLAPIEFSASAQSH